MTENILIIKHRPLRECLLATGAFAAIRKHHPDAQITLLTDVACQELAEGCPAIDRVWVDPMARSWEVKTLIRMYKDFRAGQFSRVYDLETNFRTELYFRFSGRKKTEWSGAVSWCSHPHLNPKRALLHIVDRWSEQLQVTGIERVPLPSLAWLTENVSGLSLPERYVVIVPGSNRKRLEKRWHSEEYAEVIRWLYETHGLRSVIVGGDQEAWENGKLAALCGAANPIDLSRKTSLAALAEIGRRALVAIGSDTGPMYIMALVKCPSVLFFPWDYSNPYYCSPPASKNTYLIEEEDMACLDHSEVIALLDKLLSKA